MLVRFCTRGNASARSRNTRFALPKYAAGVHIFSQTNAAKREQDCAGECLVAVRSNSRTAPPDLLDMCEEEESSRANNVFAVNAWGWGSSQVSRAPQSIYCMRMVNDARLQSERRKAIETPRDDHAAQTMAAQLLC